MLLVRRLPLMNLKFPLIGGLCFLLLITSCKKENADSDKENENTPTNGFNVNAVLMVQLINNARQSGCTCGSTVMPPVAAVSWNNLLAKAAFDHSTDMNTNNYFNHNSQQGIDPGTRITNAGYTWSTYGENIAQGYTTEQAVVTGWLNSEGHCKNLMNGSFKEMGVGRSGNYWTQEFATRR